MESHAGTYVFVVLVAPLKVFYVSSQVGVDDAEAGVVEHKPHCYASFVPLQKKNVMLNYEDASIRAVLWVNTDHTTKTTQK